MALAKQGRIRNHSGPTLMSFNASYFALQCRAQSAFLEVLTNWGDQKQLFQHSVTPCVEDPRHTRPSVYQALAIISGMKSISSCGCFRTVDWLCIDGNSPTRCPARLVSDELV